MIKLSNISKIFRSEEFDTAALNGVNLEVKQGEFVAIMGPSGCGKSTLLNILGLIDTPTEGTYILNGKDVSTLTESERTDIRKGLIGFVFQSFNLIDELNVNENTELPLLYTNTPAQERQERTLEVLRRLNMAQRGKHYPSQLSGGQQQRVAIARAIINFLPSGKTGGLILADEPTGNLDSKNSLEVMELLSELNSQGITIVMVTHSQHDATYANRIINLFDGQVVDNINDKL
ncbi:MAG: ABC transporter ATP-binding protein [Bacteroidaceae bacterium]|nr:ABC transporter ATP-binding protein [Bacteroidaceae bacterium]